MITATATATEMQNNFGRYLNLVMSGQEIIVTKNGKEVGRFIPKEAAVSYLTDSLTGILKEKNDIFSGAFSPSTWHILSMSFFPVFDHHRAGADDSHRICGGKLRRDGRNL